jgi:ribonuclease HI
VDPELAEVCSLERRLLDPAVRARPEAVRALLHPEFAEIGASGRTWDRESIVAALEADPGGETAVSDLGASLVADGVALVTYATEGSKRSSLWVRADDGWQVRFHQGTPA